MKLFTMKRHSYNTADHINAHINEKLNQVDFVIIIDIHDYFGRTTSIIANNPILTKCMYLHKVDMYEKAHTAIKAGEYSFKDSHSSPINTS
jgi:hypothetical protein